jgi:hypothetical protein
LASIDTYGDPQSCLGQQVQSVVVEAFVCKGQLVSSANVLFLKLSGSWYRAAIDAGTFHWRLQAKTPEPWFVPEEGWSYPHTDLGQQYSLAGSALSRVNVSGQGNSVRVEFSFSSGRRVVLFNGNDSSSYHVA